MTNKQLLMGVAFVVALALAGFGIAKYQASGDPGWPPKWPRSLGTSAGL